MRSVIVSWVQKYSATRDPVQITKTASLVSRTAQEPFEHHTGGSMAILREGPCCATTWARHIFSPYHSLLLMCIHDTALQFNPIPLKLSMSDVLVQRSVRSSLDTVTTSLLIPALCGPTVMMTFPPSSPIILSHIQQSCG